MEKPIAIAVGDQYPFPFPGSAGATANFLTSGANVLQLCIPDLSGDEIKALKKGKIEGGIMSECGNILWLFQFFGKQGPAFTFDAPFDARIIPSESLNLHDISNARHRLVIDIHVFDQHRIIKVLRSVTIPPKLTLLFMLAVQDQLSATTVNPPSHWLALSPDDLASTTKMMELGK
jgi:hypothetical protein